MSTDENTTPATEAPPVTTPDPTVVIVDTLMLQNALSKYVKVIANKAARRIVQGIRMIAAEERLDLFGTDLELSLHMTVPAEVVLTPSSAIVADYKALLKAVKAIRDRQTRLALYGTYLIVSDAGTSTHISSFGDVEDFPEPPRRLAREDYLTQHEAGAPEEQKQDAGKFEKTKEAWRKAAVLEFQEFAVAAEALATAFLYVMPGISKGYVRYALNGVYMTGNGRGGAEFVASNTHVLYRHDAALTAGTLPDNAGFILLPKMADWLTKNVSGTLTVKTDPNTVFVEGCDFILIGRRIEGMFPRYRDVIPSQCRMPGRLAVSRKEFLAALKAAHPHASPETHRIDLLPNAEGDRLIVQAIRDGVTTFTTEIPAASRKWLADSFNGEFLIDFLAVHPGENVTICHNDPVGEDGSGPSAVYDGERLFLAMPVNNARKVTPEELESYRAALAEPDQEFLTSSSTPAPIAITKRPPAFKAIVARAKADPGYLSALLAALGIQAAVV